MHPELDRKIDAVINEWENLWTSLTQRPDDESSLADVRKPLRRKLQRHEFQPYPHGEQVFRALVYASDNLFGREREWNQEPARLGKRICNEWLAQPLEGDIFQADERGNVFFKDLDEANRAGYTDLVHFYGRLIMDGYEPPPPSEEERKKGIANVAARLRENWHERLQDELKDRPAFESVADAIERPSLSLSGRIAWENWVDVARIAFAIVLPVVIWLVIQHLGWM